MGAKQSAETRLAIKLYKGGMPQGKAAKKAGIHPVTLWRALKKK